MESHDSYPVFHTRLTRTMRRRLTWPNGTSPGWLILSTDQLTETVADAASVISNELTEMVHHDSGAPPNLSIPGQR